MKRPFKITIVGEIQYLSESDPTDLVAEAILKKPLRRLLSVYEPGRYRIKVEGRRIDILPPTKGD